MRYSEREPPDDPQSDLRLTLVPAIGCRSLKASVAKPAAIWHSSVYGGRLAALPNGCGCSSAVEHDLAKVGVEGSIPFARSN